MINVLVISFLSLLSHKMIITVSFGIRLPLRDHHFVIVLLRIIALFSILVHSQNQPYHLFFLYQTHYLIIEYKRVFVYTVLQNTV